MALVHQHGWDPGIFATSPWFAVLADVSCAFLAHATFPTLDELNVLLAPRQLAAGLPSLRAVFSPPKTTHRKKRKVAIDPASLYDVRIAEHGELPTREDDWHDFFNVLAFAAFPRSKWALHTRQSRLLRARIAADARRLPGARTREQDALTLLDEGGVIVACEANAYATLHACSEARDPEFAAHVASAVARCEAQLVPFGHALFEHLAAGLPCPLAIPQLVPISRAPTESELSRDRSLRATWLDGLDRALCQQLADPAQFSKPSGVKGLVLADYPAPFAQGQKLVPH